MRILVRSRHRKLLIGLKRFSQNTQQELAFERGQSFRSTNVFFYSLCLGKDVLDTHARKKRSSSHREEGESTETYVAQMTVFDKNRWESF